MSVTYIAGFDSPNANNGSLNVQSVNGQDSISITFTELTPGNDLILERNGGLADPDTRVVINGVTYSFIFIETGIFPSGNNDSGDKVPTSLEGQRVAIIRILQYDANGDGISDGPQQFFFTPDRPQTTAAEIDAIQNSGIKLTNRNQNPPPEPVCFVKGTLVEAADVTKPVEELAVGDKVRVYGGDLCTVLWVSKSTVAWVEFSDISGKPIAFPSGCFGISTPYSELSVSPQHHILMSGPIVRQMFGEDEVLAPAKGLTGLPGVRVMRGKKSVEYYHVLLERHEIIMAHGVATESFYPGPTAVRMLTPAQRASLYAVVPALKDDPENGYGPTARKKITRRQAEELVQAMLAERKAKAVAAE